MSRHNSTADEQLREIIEAWSGIEDLLGYLLTLEQSLSSASDTGVILFAGGDGTVNLAEGIPQLGSNFLVRSRQFFAKRGLPVAVYDPSEDFGALSDDDRMSKKHADEVLQVLTDFKQRTGVKKIYLVGTSRGTISAAYLANYFKQDVNGVVLTSTLFRSSRSGPGLSGFDFATIRQPLLFVHHASDGCTTTPPSRTVLPPNSKTSEYCMKKIYLDYNILVRLMNGNDPLLEELICSIDRNKFQLVYSPAHIEEMAVSTKRNNYPIEKTKEKLAFLSALTNNTEILPFRRNDVFIIEDLGAYLCKEHPESCYARVSENYKNNDLAEKIEEEFLDEVTEKNIHGNSPNVMNNIHPEVVLSEPIYDINIKEAIFISLLSLGKYNKDQIRELMGVGSNLQEFTFPSIKKDYQVIEIAMQIVFNKLEEIRYRPEKKEKFRSRLHDVTHAIYAAYCDYFITEDSKLLDKATAAYAYLKQKTTITNIEGLRSIVSN